MPIRTRRDFENLRAIGLIVRRTLDRTAAAVRPRIATGELDRHRRARAGEPRSRIRAAESLRISRRAVHQRQ